MSEDTSAWIQFFGRLHPAVLHLPIGLIAGLAVIELNALVRRRPGPTELTRLLAWLVAASAVIAAASGYVLSLEGDHVGTTLNLHMYCGIGLAVACVLMAAVNSRARTARPYYALLLVVLAVMLPTGHLGGSLTHGDDFLTQPFAEKRPTASAPAASETTSPTRTPTTQPLAAPAPAGQPEAHNLFATQIAPILIDRCGTCHGQSRQKAGLAMHTAEALARGSRHGPVFVAGKPGESEIVRRLRLPVDDEDHMPPAEKPQPSEEQIRLVEQWIASGASFTAAAAATNASREAQDRSSAGHVDRQDADPTQAVGTATVRERSRSDRPAAGPGPVKPAAVLTPVPPADPAALAALRENLVHCEVVAEGSHRLWVDFAAIARSTDDALAARLIEPLLPQLDTLALARSAVGDKVVGLLARATHLRSLDLRGTKVTDAGLAAIAGLPELHDLALGRTHLTDAAAEHLAAMPALERVYIWSAGLSPQAVAKLRERRPGLHVDAGDAGDAKVKQVEGEIKLTGDLPPPGPPPAAAQASAAGQPAASGPPTTAGPQPAPDPKPADRPAAPTGARKLRPANSICPVSGKPIDIKYVVLHKNRLIGFCCGDCAAKFWADPDKYETKLASTKP
ncbi:MAG: hypothetical protein HY718_04765 [Planctomycetes bacterium]|nr:hypothetical protein [Planctomycetota bacterium]